MNACRFVLVVASAVCAAGFALGASAVEKSEARPMTTPAVSLRGEGTIPALDGAVAWLNSKPLSAEELRGKVVLIVFWTYTCINWQRTLPHLRAWADKYRSKGLVVFGIHTPEFGFDRGRP
jgi:thiol-disulfide isomerase/thioredoxin